ncbi:MAG: hypothetical protein AB7G44_10395 [Bacteroidia bacterium]
MKNLLLFGFFLLVVSCKKEKDDIVTDPCDLPADSFFVAASELLFLNFPLFDTLYYGNSNFCCDKYYRIDTLPVFTYLQNCNETSGNKIWQRKGVAYAKVLNSDSSEYLSFTVLASSDNFNFTYDNSWQGDFMYNIKTNKEPDMDSLVLENKTFYNVYKLDTTWSQFSQKVYYYNQEYGLVAIEDTVDNVIKYLQTDLLE